MNDGEAPVEKGYVRLYTDHTGRWYEDITIEEHEKRIKEAQDDPFYQFVAEEIRKEIDREIIKQITKGTDEKSDSRPI